MKSFETDICGAVLLALLSGITFGSDVKSSDSHLSLSLMVGQDTTSPNGEIWDEKIIVNNTDSTVSVEQTRLFDGSYSLDVFDFSQRFHLTTAVVLGELERGELPYSHLCFISSLGDSDLLPADSILRLRQKNPGVKKVAETDMGTVSATMDVLLTAEQAGRLLSSPLIQSRCADAADGVYVSDADFQKWSEKAQESNGDDEWPLLKLRHLDSLNLTRCKSQSAVTKPCLCEFTSCIPWYPCGWKFCKNAADEANPPESANELPSGEVKCGIKTCRKCFAYLYEVPQKQLCMWDE